MTRALGQSGQRRAGRPAADDRDVVRFIHDSMVLPIRRVLEPPVLELLRGLPGQRVNGLDDRLDLDAAQRIEMDTGDTTDTARRRTPGATVDRRRVGCRWFARASRRL